MVVVQGGTSTSGSSLDGWGGGGGGGGAEKGRGDCRRSRPGEGADTPPAQLGGMVQAPRSGSGAEPEKPALFALENPPKLTTQ